MVNVQTLALAMILQRHLARQKVKPTEVTPMNDPDPGQTAAPAQDPAQDPNAVPAPPDATAQATATSDPAQTAGAPSAQHPPCTATQTATSADTTASQDGAPQAQTNPFVETAMAAAKLVDLLRKNPEALQFLDALLACLKPASTNGANTTNTTPPQGG